MTSRRIEIPGNRFFLSVLLLLLFLAPPSPLLALKTPSNDACFVYPMPASGDFAWAVYVMPSSGKALVTIYNEVGDMVAQVEELKPAGLQQTGLDLFYYRKGVYLCRVMLTLDTGGTKKLKTFKFMVTR